MLPESPTDVIEVAFTRRQLQYLRRKLRDLASDNRRSYKRTGHLEYKEQEMMIDGMKVYIDAKLGRLI